jgi:hypothetical protein
MADAVIARVLDMAPFPGIECDVIMKGGITSGVV